MAEGGTDGELERKVREWLPRVRRLLFRLRGFRGDVDDLAQEVFLRWWQGRERLQDPGREQSFLFGIAVRVQREDARQERRALRSEGAGDAEPQSREAEPLAASIAGELRRDAERALQRLPTKLREVLVLSVYEGLTPTEIAPILELTAEAVRHRLFRARRTLERALTGHSRER